MLRLLVQLTVLCVCVPCMGCELIMRDLPPKKHVDADGPPGGPDAGKVDDVEAGPHTEKPHSDAGPNGDGDGGGDGDGDGDGDMTGDDAGGMDAAPPSVDAAAPDAGPDLPPVDPDGCDGAAQTVYFLDGDGDGYGDSTTAVAACKPPTDPGTWVEVGKDCHDGEFDVNPGQTIFFEVGYVPLSGAGLSFDYDCDKSEVAGPNQEKAPVSCPGLLTCAGSGYAPNEERADLSGVNKYCGSNVIATCKSSGLTACAASEVTVEDRFVCK